MKRTKPILGADYRTSWSMEPGYLAKRFKEIERENKRAAEQAEVERLDRISRTVTPFRSAR